MRPRFRGKQSLPMVMSTLALIVALGGTTYAAATIGSDDIIDGSIRSADVKTTA